MIAGQHLAHGYLVFGKLFLLKADRDTLHPIDGNAIDAIHAPGQLDRKPWLKRLRQHAPEATHNAALARSNLNRAGQGISHENGQHDQTEIAHVYVSKTPPRTRSVAQASQDRSR